MIYVAYFKWPCGNEILCAGKNKKAVLKEALKIAKQQYGTGFVRRDAACMSAKVTMDDIAVEQVTVV